MPNDPAPQVRPPAVSKGPPPGRKFPCVKCGARLDFDPRARSLTCPYCGHTERVQPGRTEAVERDLEEYLARQSGESTVAGRPDEVKCGTCGAVVLLEDKLAADRCPYCGTFLENKPEAAQSMIAPEWLLPFAVDQRKATEAFNRWLAGLWFAPGALKRFADLGRLNGVYVPFWTFDSMTYTFYTGARGDDYQEPETYTETETYTDSDGQTRTREVTKTRMVTRTIWTPVSGEVQHFFDDVCVCASTSLPARYAATLTPKELKGLEEFKSEFLSGFTTERYTVGPKEGFETAKQIMDGVIRGLCVRDIGGNHQRLDSVDTQHLGVTFKHVLLPVWLASYRYRDKSYRVLVNGQTGHVVGDRPYSWAKIVALVLTILAVVAAVVYFVSRAKGAAARPPAPRPAAVRLLAGHVEDELAGELVGQAQGGGAHFHLPLVEVPAGVGVGQAGDLQRQGQQAQELVDLLLLPVERDLFAAHGQALPGETRVRTGRGRFT
jgi:DNA-directed RNA polymerase subunit RPC12/RpoP